jgi:hypothetical protein
VRAAITIENFRPGPGGVESVAWQLARELGELGVDLTVLCRQAAKPAPPGVRVETLGGLSFWQPLRVLDFSRRAARAGISGGFDVVQAFSRTRHQDVPRRRGHAAYMESATRSRACPLLTAPPTLPDRGSRLSRRATDVACNSARRRGSGATAWPAPGGDLNGVDLDASTRGSAAGGARGASSA